MTSKVFAQNKKPKVVIDTNVWISGLIFGGMPAQILEQFINGEILVITSEEMISELRGKIHHKFPLFATHLPLLETLIKQQAILVKLGIRPVSVSRDADDNKVIETALVGGADYVISGDKDLLVIKSYKNVAILKPADFINQIADNSQ